MSTKHTPGPWQLSTVPFEIRSNDSAASIYGPMDIGGGACFIADISRSPGDQQATANAKLIAAAPDLLEAAQAAIRYDIAIKLCGNNPIRMKSFCTAEGEDLDFLYMDWISKSEKAIKKATE